MNLTEKLLAKKVSDLTVSELLMIFKLLPGQATKPVSDSSKVHQPKKKSRTIVSFPEFLGFQEGMNAKTKQVATRIYNGLTRFCDNNSLHEQIGIVDGKINLEVFSNFFEMHHAILFREVRNYGKGCEEYIKQRLKTYGFEV